MVAFFFGGGGVIPPLFVLFFEVFLLGFRGRPKDSDAAQTNKL